MSWAMWWPIGLLVLSNVFYHVCSKSLPAGFHPLAATSLTYLVGAVFAFVVYLMINRRGNFFGEFRHVNWVPFVLAAAIVGLEAGAMYMYRAGWEISVGQLVMSAILAIALVVIGVVFFRESLTLNKVVGIILCLGGLVFINR